MLLISSICALNPSASFSIASFSPLTLSIASFASFASFSASSPLLTLSINASFSLLIASTTFRSSSCTPSPFCARAASAT